jgi:hypothetical protein
MKQRYSIWGREYGADHDVEIVQVNAKPEDMRKALGLKTLKLGSGKKITKYTYLRIVENEDG